ncbi:cell cycle regulator of non-homologous end joining [Rhinatrema bivittatum]|uniref:cell cycle regulator of non-homologous end joining n=1 Tax=Rhinatrema bivittatum TaxID=194408 RepID=UPI001129C6E5|nr:cell cycle regulator of non-homologous end joining [Rhinatrema bivittatum]
MIVPCICNPSKMDVGDRKAKSRVLPQWMTSERKEASTAQAAKPRKAGEQPEKCTLRKVTVYCMNEAELVGEALCVLNRSLGCSDNDTLWKEERAEPPQCPAVGSEVTDVSSPRKPTCSSPRDGSGSQDEDNDPLKFVREIFFN